MRRILVFCAFSLVAWAQAPAGLFEKGPPEVDDALRARIKSFYQAHVDGNFRAAEKLVAEDTQEFFYNSNKPRYVSFEISRIEYSENFTKAKATIVCKQYVMVPGFTDKPLDVPTPSDWKLDGGKWCWYIDKERIKQTPFGKTNIELGSKTSGTAKIPSNDEVLAGFNRITASRTMVELKDAPETITITNGLPGPATLLLTRPKFDAISVTLSKTQLKAGETAVVTIRKTGEKVPSGRMTFVLDVEQTRTAIAVVVTF